jgi:hypothetical protein
MNLPQSKRLILPPDACSQNWTSGMSSPRILLAFLREAGRYFPSPLGPFSPKVVFIVLALVGGQHCEWRGRRHGRVAGSNRQQESQCHREGFPEGTWLRLGFRQRRNRSS